MTHLLDTDTCIGVLRQRPGMVQRLSQLAPTDYAVSMAIVPLLRLAANGCRQSAVGRSTGVDGLWLFAASSSGSFDFFSPTMCHRLASRPCQLYFHLPGPMLCTSRVSPTRRDCSGRLFSSAR